VSAAGRSQRFVVIVIAVMTATLALSMIVVNALSARAAVTVSTVSVFLRKILLNSLRQLAKCL